MTRFCAQAFLLILLLISSQPARAEKTDIVFLHNGDRITGEVKSLFRGKLEFKTDHMGTLYIEWEEILEIVSQTGQSIELTNGQRFYGALAKPENNDTLAVKTGQGEVGIDTADVVSMYPVESGIWDRLDIMADFGFSWDKGSNVGKYNLSINTEYRLPESLTKASFTTELTTQSDASSTKRANLNGIHNIFKPQKKFLAYFGNLEHNDELGIDLRALAGAGYGWVPIRSQRNWFSLGGGLDINRELPTDGESETNLEAVGMITYQYFKYSSPKREFNFDMRVFPSITDFGRWRANLNSDFRFELISDLFWKMGVYFDYDSAPISSDAASTDYGITSGVSYKF
jgi:hypothetical protein